MTNINLIGIVLIIYSIIIIIIIISRTKVISHLIIIFYNGLFLYIISSLVHYED